MFFLFLLITINFHPEKMSIWLSRHLFILHNYPLTIDIVNKKFKCILKNFVENFLMSTDEVAVDKSRQYPQCNGNQPRSPRATANKLSIVTSWCRFYYEICITHNKFTTSKLKLTEWILCKKKKKFKKKFLVTSFALIR